MNPFAKNGRQIKESDACNLKGKYQLSWVEDCLELDKSVDGQRGIAHTRRYVGSSLKKNRIKIFARLIVLVGILVMSRTFYLQIIRGPHFRALAEGNRIRIKPIVAERGIIFDRFHNNLVENVPSFELVMSPQLLPSKAIDRDKMLEQLSKMSGEPVDTLAEFIKKYSFSTYESIVIKDNVDRNTALRLYVSDSDLPGVQVDSRPKRNYLYTIKNNNATSSLSLSHLIGYLGKLTDEELNNSGQTYLPFDKIGKSGLEKQYEKQLRGIYGKKKVEVNSQGREQSVLATESPIPGDDLILTIDLAAQQKLETLIRKAAAGRPSHYAAIALNPQNGEILAMVSWPAFDNNDFTGEVSSTIFKQYINDLNRPLFNRVISGLYPPGSTVKLIVSAAALQEGIINFNTTVLSTGELAVGKWIFKDWKSGGHGITNVIKALAWSVNTFFYYIGGGYKKFAGLGFDRLVKYFYIFGLGQKTGIDLPGEQGGFIPTREWKKQQVGDPWYIGDTYNMSIGQGYVLVTPAQNAVWAAAIANGGMLVTPHLGMTLYDSYNKITTTLNYKTTKINVDLKNISLVKEGMRSCVISGSCQLLKSLPFASAGKTGTAQWNASRPTHAWFTSFAPYDNPKIVVTVLAEEGGEGATAAMPIARDFLDWWGKKYLTTR